MMMSLLKMYLLPEMHIRVNNAQHNNQHSGLLFLDDDGKCFGLISRRQESQAISLLDEDPVK
jgi:hypothetical protein